MNYERNIVVNENNNSKSREAYSALSNSGWAHNTVSNDNEIFRKKETMDRVARNHDVSRQTANHNIIAHLDHAILLLPRCPRFFSHLGGTVVVERIELWLEGVGNFFSKDLGASYAQGRPASNLQVTSCCASET